jgi:serine/threonine-protein kinase RsbW
MPSTPKSTPKSKSKEFRLKLPADTQNLDIIRRFIAGIAENMGFNEEEVYKIELAVDEACSNVVKHAYMTNTRPEHIINIEVIEKKSEIEIIISDKGKGFDPKKVKRPELEEYMRKMKRGGLGIYLIRELMDKVSFQIKAGIRNEVKMVKYLKTRS